MGLREEKEQLTRTAIMDAAFNLFCQQGIEPTEMMQIAKKAKVSRPTVYRYFESKDALAEEVYLRNLENMHITKLQYTAEMTSYELVKRYLDVVLQELQMNPRQLVYDAMYNLYASRKHLDPTTLPQHPFNIPRYQQMVKAKQIIHPDNTVRVQGTDDTLLDVVYYPYFTYVQRLAIFSFQKEQSAWDATIRQAKTLRAFYLEVLKPE